MLRSLNSPYCIGITDDMEEEVSKYDDGSASVDKNSVPMVRDMLLSQGGVTLSAW